MRKKLITSFRINKKNVLDRAKKYPFISQVIKPQIEYLTAVKEPPLIEQVHPIIYWLHHYCESCKELVDELERVLLRIDSKNILGKESFFKKFGLAKDKPNFHSSYSEIYLANFLIVNDIEILEIEPKTSKLNKFGDFKIELDKNEIITELITPGIPKYDFEEQKQYLFDKLERIETDGLLIRVSGFESFDSSDIDNLWGTRVPLPSQNQLNEIISNFRKHASNIDENQLPIELPVLCSTYPRIKIEIASKIHNEEFTLVSMTSSRTGEGLPTNRIVKLITDETKHLHRDDTNLIFVDFSNWSVVVRLYLEHPYFRKIITKSIDEKISDSIDGVFSYIRSNKNGEELIYRSILFLNPNSPILNKTTFIQFIKIWDQYKPLY